MLANLSMVTHNTRFLIAGIKLCGVRVHTFALGVEGLPRKTQTWPMLSRYSRTSLRCFAVFQYPFAHDLGWLDKSGIHPGGVFPAGRPCSSCTTYSHSKNKSLRMRLDQQLYPVPTDIFCTTAGDIRPAFLSGASGIEHAADFIGYQSCVSSCSLSLRRRWIIVPEPWKTQLDF